MKWTDNIVKDLRSTNVSEIVTSNRTNGVKSRPHHQIYAHLIMLRKERKTESLECSSKAATKIKYTDVRTENINDNMSSFSRFGSTVVRTIRNLKDCNDKPMSGENKRTSVVKQFLRVLPFYCSQAA